MAEEMTLGEICGVFSFLMVVVLLGFAGGEVWGEDAGKKQLVQELCSKTEYDFCEQVPQAPIYKIKLAKEE